MAWLTGTISPPWSMTLLPMRTVISGAGHDAGEATAAPVIEPQCPAVSTQLGAISVPVHRNALPKVISATDGYFPAGAAWPPTIANDGLAVKASTAPAVTSACVIVLFRFMGVV